MQGRFALLAVFHESIRLDTSIEGFIIGIGNSQRIMEYKDGRSRWGNGLGQIVDKNENGGMAKNGMLKIV